MAAISKTAGGATPPKPPTNPALENGAIEGQAAPVVGPSPPKMHIFGGNRGGKKRDDGLPPGSPEAIAADKKKDAARKVAERAAARAAEVPAALPPSPVASGPLAVNPGAPPPLGTVGDVAAPPVLFVPWSVKLLSKPARLATRVIDRLRSLAITRKLDKAKLPEDVTAEVKKDLRWRDEAVNDFGDALAECVAIELNQRQISARHSHWLNLAISGGELALGHFAVCDRIDKLIKAAEKKP
jgi:hypothetical protein